VRWAVCRSVIPLDNDSFLSSGRHPGTSALVSFDYNLSTGVAGGLGAGGLGATGTASNALPA
jgi:hypothetical protein